MAEQDEWSSNANEVLQISIVRAGSKAPEKLSTFHPQFTYPIFGEQERIFGYQGLHIKFRFAAHDLRPNVEISYDRKFKAVGDTKPTDILGTLKEWIPEGSFDKSSSFDAQIQKDTSARDFKPPGEHLESYTSKGRNFEIWSGELTDPAVRTLIDRMQVFISFFIEGGTPLELNDQEWTLARWRVYFVYEKLSIPPNTNCSPYSIVGYSTSYRFITYLPTTANPTPRDFTLPPPVPIHPTELPSRARISQFLILPTHHSHGHGTHLYNAMVTTFLASPTITEITVEDPNEAFDDLRDYCDYTRLQAQKVFAPINLRIDIDPKLSQKRIGVRVPTGKLLDLDLLDRIRTTHKIAPRQFSRLVEMHLLSRIAPHARQAGTARLTQRGRASDPDDRAFFYWRMLVKQRVYRKNKDVLIQLDRLERAEKVEQTVGEVAGDYERLLREMGKFGRSGSGGGTSAAKTGKDTTENSSSLLSSSTAAAAAGRSRGKRKVIDDDDDDEDDDDEAGGNGNGNNAGMERGDQEMPYRGTAKKPEAKRARSEAL